MARTATETANTLLEMFYETIDDEIVDMYRITWPQLRSLAAVPRLDKVFLREVSDVLTEKDFCLVPFNDFLLFSSSAEFKRLKMIPDRLLERFLPNPEDIELDEDKDENEDK